MNAQSEFLFSQLATASQHRVDIAASEHEHVSPLTRDRVHMLLDVSEYNSLSHQVHERLLFGDRKRLHTCVLDTLVAVLLRDRVGLSGGHFSFADFQELTRAWRHWIGPVNPDDGPTGGGHELSRAARLSHVVQACSQRRVAA